ncbi:MAG: hypothetical protein GY765_25720, partial [bacterium]|nr:hypothetical protein [bacterium]
MWINFLPPFGMKIAAIAGAFLFFLILLRMSMEKRNVSLKRQAGPVILRFLVIACLVFVFFNPVTISPKQEEGGKRLIILVDRSASMGVRDVAGKTRFEAALSALLDPKTKAAFKSSFVPEIRLFDRDTREMNPGKPGEPDGSGTDIGKALIRAVEDLGTDSGAGILLVSDGRSTNGDPFEGSQLALARSVPVWTLCMGGKIEHRDVWIKTRSSELLAFGNDEVEISALVHRAGFPNHSVRVDLIEDGTVLDTKEVLPGTGNGTRVSFRITAPGKGEHRYVLRAVPLKGEADLLNNERPVFLRVVGEKVRVLLIEGRPHWDTKFLVQALKRHERVDLTAIYRIGPKRYSAVVSQQGKFRREESNLFPETEKELFAYDICIFGRNCDAFFTEGTEKRFTRFVSEKGGGLVFSRGKPYGGRFYPLAKFEPVVWGDGVEKSVHMKLTEHGFSDPVFEFGQGGKSQELVDKLPRLDQAMITKGEKPLAMVMAESKSVQKTILAAFQQYGQGRIVTLNMAGMWRWAFREKTGDEQVYTRFWMSLLRNLLSNSDFLPGADVSLRSAARCYTDEQQMRFRIMTRGLDPKSYKPMLTVSGNGLMETVEPGKGRGGFHTVTLGPFAPGT